MGCCTDPVTTMKGTPPDPSQHVNYARGMVLGVDDFTQEFAYLAGRDQWLARDAIGYGTLSGLRVFAEDAGADGPRLHVTAGSALVPSGKLVCVPTDQCAVINKWLAKPANAGIVNRLLNLSSPQLSPPFSPPLPPPPGTSGTIALHLTLCYADCTTRPMPIPGEPCRSEDELMADSRVADDFRLELRETPPAQAEEDAVRDFVAWLRKNVEVIDTSPPPVGDETTWLEAMRPAIQPWLDAETQSPPLSPPITVATVGDYLFDLMVPLAVAQDRLSDFLRVVVRFWITEVRPRWMACRCERVIYPDQDCLLLARVSFDVEWVGGSPVGVWEIVGSPATVTIDEGARPLLVHERLLQEWLLWGSEASGGVGGAALPQPLAITDTPTFAGLTTTGGVRVAVSQGTNNQTLDATQHVVLCPPSVINLTLPPASVPGRTYVIKKGATGTVTVTASGADSIDGNPSTTVNQLNAKTLVSDGAGNWYVIATVA